MNPSDWLAKLPSPLALSTPGEPRQWYRIRAEAKPDGEIADEAMVYVYGVIGGWWSGVDAAEFVREIRDIKAKTLRVHINSIGGSVYDGNAIFQALRNHSARIVTYVDALAASAASIVAMAGDKRICAPYAEIMVHKAWGIAIGDDDTMEKARDDLARTSRNLAKVYANRSTSDATADDWLEVMKAETWYSAEDAVEAGLMHEVQEDAEKTVPDDSDGDAQAMNRYALEFFGLKDHAARLAMRHPANDPPPPTQAAPNPPAAEPDQPETKEGGMATLSTGVLARLGLDEGADEAAVLAALDALEAKAVAPNEPDTEDDGDVPVEPTAPDPEPQPEAEPAAKVNADLTAKVALLTEQVQAMGAQLAAANAEKAAATKAQVLDAAAKAGKFAPADRNAWSARYDKSPEVTADVLAAIPAGSAVPVDPAGEVGDPEPSAAAWSDSEYERLFGEKVG